tara:strand:- start:3956 stop:4864 length:909 start_codon:yes stop_codon:yes gene_type:complete
METYTNRYLQKLANTTLSESSLAKKEHENTKIPRWFREKAMQEAILKDMGFEKGEEPVFKKNEDPYLQGANAYYDPREHEIHYDRGEWTPGILAHEIGHSTMDISPLAKAMNVGSDLAGVMALPLTIASDSWKTNKLAPTLLEGLTASGGMKNKLNLLKAGLKGRGAKWGLGAAVLGSLGTLAEEARASILGSKSLNALEQEGIIDEEQSQLARDTMRKAYGTYLLGAPIGLAAGSLGKNIASALTPRKAKLPLAAILAGLGAYGTLYGHGHVDAAYNPEKQFLKKKLHESLGKKGHSHDND